MSLVKMNLFPPDSSREFGDFDEVTGESFGTKRGVHSVSLNPTTSSSFNEMHSVSQVGFIRTAPVYSFIPANFRSFTAGTGAVTVDGDYDNEFKCSSGTALADYGALQSFRSVNAEYGRGIGVRFGARFPSNTSTTWQGVGLLSLKDEASFGYNGTAFGVWHRYGGRVEIRTLTLTIAAGGAETATVTVSDTIFTIPLTAGTTAHNAKEIADYITANSSAWKAYQNGSTVQVVAQSDGAKSGAWSFSSTGTATASFAQNRAGVTKTSDHTPLASWNGDDVSSWFDPAYGNVYEIQFQMGYGNIYFYVLDPDKKRFILVHTVKWLNTKDKTNVTNPSLRVGMYATAIGTTTNVDVYCSFFDAFVENGPEKQTRNPRGFTNTKSISTTPTNILSIRNKATFNAVINQAEIVPLLLNISSESSKTTVVNLITNATVASDDNWTNVGTNLISEYDTSGTTISGGTLLASFNIIGGGSQSIDLTTLGIRLPPTLKMTISAYVVGAAAAADVTASLSWIEEI